VRTETRATGFAILSLALTCPAQEFRPVRVDSYEGIRDDEKLSGR
jgi:hypothetical protein